MKKLFFALLIIMSGLLFAQEELYNSRGFNFSVVDSLVLQDSSGTSLMTIYYDSVQDSVYFVSRSSKPLSLQNFSLSAVNVMNIVKANDGAGSGVVADSLDGYNSSDFLVGGDSTWTYITLTKATAPSWAEGIIFFDDNTGALSFYNAESDVTLQIGEETWISVRNQSGATIPDFTPVYVTGASGNRALIALAQANSEASAHVAGVTTHAIEHNSNGYVTVSGSINGIDTDGSIAGETWTSGEDLYLSASYAGVFTDIRPATANDWVVEVGHVLTAGNDGSFLLHIRTDGVLDEDAMTTNSTTRPASQQSVKAYVDATVRDSTEIAAFGYVAGAHTDSTGVAGFGFYAGVHTTDTNLDSTAITVLGFYAGAHLGTPDSTTIDALNFVPDSEMTTHSANATAHHSAVDSTAIVALGFVAGAHAASPDSATIDALNFVPDSEMTTHSANATVHHSAVDSTAVAGYGFVAGAHADSSSVDALNFVPDLEIANMAEDGDPITNFDGTAYRTLYIDINGDVQLLAHGTSGQVLTTNGATADPSWTNAGSLGNLVEDISPQLGASLDANGFDIQIDSFDKLVLDDDLDTYIYGEGDDTIRFVTGDLDTMEYRVGSLLLAGGGVGVGNIAINVSPGSGVSSGSASINLNPRSTGDAQISMNFLDGTDDANDYGHFLWKDSGTTEWRIRYAPFTNIFDIYDDIDDYSVIKIDSDDDILHLSATGGVTIDDSYLILDGGTESTWLQMDAGTDAYGFLQWEENNVAKMQMTWYGVNNTFTMNDAVNTQDIFIYDTDDSIMDYKVDVTNKNSERFVSQWETGKPDPRGSDDIITIIAMGQSNMVGHDGGGGDLSTNALVKTWNETAVGWVLADPAASSAATKMFPEYTPNNNNIAFHFAKQMAEVYGDSVRLLYEAHNGRHIGEWINNGEANDWYADMESQIAAASVTEVDVILWHQGEANSIQFFSSTTNELYADSVGMLIDSLRAEIWTSGTTPFIGGEMTNDRTDNYQNGVYSNMEMFFGSPYIAVAALKDLPTESGSEVHFDGSSLQLAGRQRYWAAYQSIPRNKTNQHQDATFPLGGGTERSVFRSIQIWVEPGAMPGTDIDVEHWISNRRSHYPPTLTNANDIAKTETDGSFSLSADGTTISVTMPTDMTIVSIVNATYQLHDMNSSASDVYFVYVQAPSTTIDIQTFKNQTQSASDWTTIMDTGDLAIINITFTTDQ